MYKRKIICRDFPDTVFWCKFGLGVLAPSFFQYCKHTNFHISTPLAVRYIYGKTPGDFSRRKYLQITHTHKNPTEEKKRKKISGVQIQQSRNH